MLNIEKKLDKVFQALSVNKKCFYCNNPASEIHHLVRRSYALYRWDRRNALPVCRNCHNGIHFEGLKEPEIPFEIEDYHQYKVNHCLSDEDFLRMKCVEYGIEYTEETFRKNRKVSKPVCKESLLTEKQITKSTKCKIRLWQKLPLSVIANEYRRKMWKEAYQKKKVLSKKNARC